MRAVGVSEKLFLLQDLYLKLIIGAHSWRFLVRQARETSRRDRSGFNFCEFYELVRRGYRIMGQGCLDHVKLTSGRNTLCCGLPKIKKWRWSVSNFCLRWTTQITLKSGYLTPNIDSSRDIKPKLTSSEHEFHTGNSIRGKKAQFCL